jgi:hypothetical protein
VVQRSLIYEGKQQGSLRRMSEQSDDVAQRPFPRINDPKEGLSERLFEHLMK